MGLREGLIMPTHRDTTLKSRPNPRLPTSLLTPFPPYSLPRPGFRASEGREATPPERSGFRWRLRNPRADFLPSRPASDTLARPNTHRFATNFPFDRGNDWHRLSRETVCFDPRRTTPDDVPTGLVL